MSYGIIKVDTITFTDGGVDKSIQISGLVQNPTFSGNVTCTGTISGVTITGSVAQFTTITGGNAGFTTVTGTTVTGTTANFVSGVFTSQISGTTVTGTTASFTSGNFTNISGGTHTITSGVFASGTAANPSISFVGDADTGIYASAANQISITTSGTERLRVDAAGQIELASLGTAAAPAYSFTADPNTGIYSPGADQVAISTNGTGRLFVNANGTLSTVSANAAVASFTGPINSYIDLTDGTETFRTQFISNVPGIGTVGSTALLFRTNNTERMRLDSSGRLGLGTSSPNSLFTAANGSIETNRTFYNRLASSVAVADRGLLFEIDGTQYGRVYAPNGKSVAIQAGAGTLTDALTVDQSGRVGIGTTGPAHQLDVVNDSGDSVIRARSGNGASLMRLRGSSAALAAFNAVISNDNVDGVHWYLGGDGSQNTLVVKTNSTERARIDSSGRLLVGTSSARSNILGIGGLFQQEGANNDGARMFSVIYGKADAGDPLLALGKHRSNSIGGTTIVNDGDGVGQLLFTGSDGTNFITAASIRGQVDGTPGTNDMPGRLVFSTTADGASSPTERMRIRNDGRILLGTTTDGGAGGLTVRPSASEGAAQLIFDRTNTTNTSTVVVFENNDGTVGTITYSNTAVAYNTTSDYRLKENVVPLTGAANRLNQLQVHRFNFIADPDKTVDGFLAHEAQAVVPECVTGTKDEIDDEGNPVYQGIDQSKLVPLLTAALQEALAEIASLKDRVAALEAQ